MQNKFVKFNVFYYINNTVNTINNLMEGISYEFN